LSVSRKLMSLNFNKEKSILPMIAVTVFFSAVETDEGKTTVI